jgi:hypothetical protein
MIEKNIERYYTVSARAISTGDWGEPSFVLLSGKLRSMFALNFAFLLRLYSILRSSPAYKPACM